MSLRVRVMSCLIAFLLVTSVAEAQEPPPPVADKNGLNVNASAAWVGDLRRETKRLPGASVGVDLPIGRGLWVAVEGGFYRSQDYAPVREDGVDLIPRVTRYEVSIAARLGRRSGNGPFFQIGAGHLSQTVDVIYEPRDTGQYEREKNWAGPGLGFDLRVSPRLALRVIGEVRWFAGFEHSTRIGAGLVYRFGPR